MQAQAKCKRRSKKLERAQMECEQVRSRRRSGWVGGGGVGGGGGGGGGGEGLGAMAAAAGGGRRRRWALVEAVAMAVAKAAVLRVAGGVGSVAVSGPRLAVYSVVQAARLFCVSEGFFAQSIKNRTAAAGRGAMCVFVCLFVSLVGGVRAAGVEPAARLVVGGGGAAAECAAAASGARGETTSTLRRWRGLSERGGAGELGSGVYACAGGARADAAVRGPTNKRWVGPQCRRGREGHIASVWRWGGGRRGGVWGRGRRTHPKGGLLGLGRAAPGGDGVGWGVRGGVTWREGHTHVLARRGEATPRARARCARARACVSCGVPCVHRRHHTL